MYTVGKGPITVRSSQQSVVEKVARRKLKKQVQVDTQFILNVGDDDIDDVNNNLIDPELWRISLSDHVPDLFSEQADYLSFD